MSKQLMFKNFSCQNFVLTTHFIINGVEDELLTRYSLLVTFYSLLLTHYLLPLSCYFLFVTCCFLLVTRYFSFGTRYYFLVSLSFTFHSSLLIRCSLLFTRYFCSLVSTIYLLNSGN